MELQSAKSRIYNRRKAYLTCSMSINESQFIGVTSAAFQCCSTTTLRKKTTKNAYQHQQHSSSSKAVSKSSKSGESRSHRHCSMMMIPSSMETLLKQTVSSSLASHRRNLIVLAVITLQIFSQISLVSSSSRRTQRMALSNTGIAITN